jgi:hypothetical protein
MGDISDKLATLARYIIILLRKKIIFLKNKALFIAQCTSVILFIITQKKPESIFGRIVFSPKKKISPFQTKLFFQVDNFDV